MQLKQTGLIALLFSLFILLSSLNVSQANFSYLYILS